MVAPRALGRGLSPRTASFPGVRVCVTLSLFLNISQEIRKLFFHKEIVLMIILEPNHDVAHFPASSCDVDRGEEGLLNKLSRSI